MTFSVLQAVYKNDNPQFLAQALQSIANQTRLPDSIILVKDGLLSADLESVILQWQSRLPLRVVGYEKNQGLAYALNYGVEFIKTDFIARMDSDDICLPTRFEKQLSYMEQHPNVSVCGTGIVEFFEINNSTIERKRLYPFHISNKSKTLYKGTPLGHPSVMLRTEILKKYKYNTNVYLNEDIDLWFRLIKDGYILENIQEYLLYFRITKETFRRRSIRKALSEFKIYFFNLWSLFGFSLRLCYPVARLFVRFLPYKFSRKLYFSKQRNKLYQS